MPDTEKITASTTQAEEKKTRRHEIRFCLKFGVTMFLALSACIILFFFVYRFQGFKDVWNKIFTALQPIIIGLVLAYLVNPVKRKTEQLLYKALKKKQDDQKAKKASRILAVTISVLLLIIVIALILAAIIPSVIASVSGLITTLPDYVATSIERIQDGALGDSQIAVFITEQLTNATEYIETWVKEKLLPEAQTYIAQITTGVISVFRTLMNFVIGIIVMVYVLMIEDTLIGQSKKILFAIAKPKTGNYIIEVTRKANDIFSGFISGKIIDSAIIGLICYIGCCIMHIPDAILVAVVIGVTNVIPVFGPFIGAIPSLLLVVIQSPWHALYLLIFIIVLQQVDGNIIGPKILGESTGLSSFWVMFAILIGGGLFGFAGMLLGVPTFALIYYLIRRAVNHRMRMKNLSEGTQDYVYAYGVDEKENKLLYPEPEEESTPEKEAKPKRRFKLKKK